jgi:glycosyltransferase involved in cell wall biosynthesis
MTAPSSITRVQAATGATVPAISVICTAKNAATTIERTLQSVLAQDFRDWQMIVVDDGSTDATASIVRRIAQSDPRIKLIVTGGVGRGRALNRALAEAEADLVANIDADDEVHPGLLRCLLRVLTERAEFAIVSTEWLRIRDAARPEWPEFNLDAPLPVTDVTMALAFYNPIYHSSVLMRKAAIVGLGGYDEQRRCVFDWDLWVRCAAAGFRLGRIGLPLVAQRVHPHQAYLHTTRLRYLLAGAAVQRRAMRASGIGWLYQPLIGLRFLWGILPLRIRLCLHDLRDAWRPRHSGLS